MAQGQSRSARNYGYPPSPSSQYGAGSVASSSNHARAEYPSFMSFSETLLLQLSWLWKGFLDSCRFDTVIATVYSDAEIRGNFLKSLILNGLSLSSIYVFDLLLAPMVRDQQKWLQRNVGWFYRVLWLLPVVGASLYLNGSWCTVVANRTFALKHGTHRQSAPATYSGLFTSLATSAYRAVMVGTSLIVSIGLSYVPIVGNALGFAFFCWVDAYYCFEFIWIARGLTLAQRIRHLEERWAYYLAFGLPSSALCMWGSSLANAALFALVLPSYIIMAMHARPVPSNPYNPAPSPPGPSTHANAHGHQPDTPTLIRYPSPFIPIRVPVFAPVLWLNDRVVGLLRLVGSLSSDPRKRIDIGRDLGQKEFAAAYGKKGRGRGRAMSDTTVQSVEEGSGAEDVVVTTARGLERERAVSGRFRVSGKKLD
ncbi:hypothetical protein SCHPADRAFT_899396 [Schizopora paradoxa]|uniref:EI24-domain-containing protein n=1 Tax=Schizopora paradoxa TaxID=27342 RepID=A0A0H2S3E7_9AGAM|nr:hypothetical protein SCHPADRAFT_899396 [Schizopora paradoxa]